MTRRARTLGGDLRLAFGVLLGALALVGTGGVLATAATAAYVERATAAVAPAIEANDAIRQSMTDVETGLRGYVLSADEEALGPYRRALARLPDQRSRLRRLLDEGPRERRLFGAQVRTIDTWLQGYAIPRADGPVGRGSFQRASFERAARQFGRFREANTRIAGYLRRQLRTLRADAHDAQVTITAGVVGLTIVGLGVGVLTTRRTSRRVRRPLAHLRDVLTDLIAGREDARAVPAGPSEVVTIARAVNALADETDRLRALETEDRRLQQRLLDLAREVRTLDPDEVVRRGLEELARDLHLSRAYVRLVEDGELQDIGHQWSAPGVPPLAELETPGSISALHAIYRRGSSMASRDVREDAFFDTNRGRLWLERTGARASVTLPIPVEDQPVGVITCMRFDVHEWTTAEIRLAEAVAAELGRALEHANLYTVQVEAVRRLEELDRAKDEFLSSVSHELRTPLTSINGYVELLEDEDPGALTAQQRRLLDVVRRNVDRLKVLIEDLLTLSRIESGAFRSSFEVLDLAALVRSGVEDIQPQASRGDVAVGVDLPDRQVPVRGDAGQLSRAVLNVLGNAVKFTPAGGRVDVGVRVDDGTARVEVRDTGVGIPEADLAGVVDRFYRAGNAVAAGVPGTGLGLVIVRTILDNHGGSLALASRVGEGTTVTLTVPRPPGQAEAEPSGIAPHEQAL